ncbi:MAG TPA: phosphate ABC transporter permease subunit PstC [Syntrophorhabdus sp.]|nr:phosphate ABC transporter permease subunit PstC [Syntrophorhabdus sp.]MDI9558899.1 phosphate ABC transporter permease subunit PstC [Pseudomonadota bacterium]OPX94591.1 MAG: Phosphate transport system permease protein PstC [Syntrophorhabdus sp. PtaB.Bin027]OQB78302.1 MAG: Phosphate transport system permease protein PstC [Deltaproteobacteria bacterium ADurb.Bin135]MBP8745542.1 phosphate ABC transporter permease subunit PstC [Syntrophorhabdus sp.]
MDLRKFKDTFSTLSIRLSLVFVNTLAFVIAIILYIKAKPILVKVSLSHLLFSTSWHPIRGDFGFFPFIIGTLGVTAIAMILAVPVCLLSAIYLSEYAHKRFRAFVRLVVDILAGIPSVIYGLCGVIAIVPLVRFLGQAIGSPTTGYSLLAGGIILAIMVAPVIISVALEVFRTIPQAARENSLALGITTWEMIKHVILRSSLHGIIAAIVLGFARAFGETIAVLMVVGNVAKIPDSFFAPAYPLPALIANNYGEMMSIPLYDSALMFSALLLMLVVGGFSLAAHIILLRIERRGYA